jgi:adenine-specific DNA methylase
MSAIEMVTIIKEGKKHVRDEIEKEAEYAEAAGDIVAAVQKVVDYNLVLSSWTYFLLPQQSRLLLNHYFCLLPRKQRIQVT